MPMTNCKNCNAEMYGRYCASCGQKVYTDKDKSVKNLMNEAFHFLTHFEGKFFTTLKAIFFKPGKLSMDYGNGIRQKYYKPVSFYLLLVVLYLVFPMFSGLNMEMKYYKRLEISGPYISKQIDKKLQQTQLTEAALTEKFHQKSKNTSKILLLLLIPLTVPIIYILYFYKKRTLFDNFILATEICNFYLLVFYLLFPMIIMAVISLLKYQPNERAISTVLSLLFAFYSMAIFKKLFAEKWWVTIIKGLIFVVLQTAMLTIIYKFIVFEITFALI